MPAYLLHGFRWPRPAIRIHVIMNNIDDAAPEWLIAPRTTAALLDNFEDLYPRIMAHLPNLRFVEQYDPLDEGTKSQPHAYVADIVHEVKLDVDIDTVRGGSKKGQWSALADLRDQLCPDGKIGWYVVVCGDEERSYSPPTTPTTPTADTPRQSNGTLFFSGISKLSSKQSNGTVYDDGSRRSTTSHSTQSRETRDGFSEHRKRSSSISRGFKRVFSGPLLRKSKSLRDLKNQNGMDSFDSTMGPPVPPLPGTAR